jgi:hypothetical protein
MLLAVISLLGFALMIGTGLCHVSQVPGFHFDEAWAANYAYRIFSEPGFWPVEAMSPYTHPWAHYLTAIFFRFFGVNLFVYRAAGVAMNVAGAFFAWAALWRTGEKKAATVLPFVLALFIPFLLNERFSLELTSFHILCFGVLLLGTQLRSIIIVFFAAVFGITSHILFLAPVLGALAVWGFRSGRWQGTHRAIVLLTAIGLWPFLWKIFREIPEKDKAIFLLASDTLVIFFVLVFEQMPRAIRRSRETLQWAIGIISLPFYFYLIFFSEGHWSILSTNGRISHPWLLALSIPMTVIGLIYLIRKYRQTKWQPGQQRFWSWFLYTVFFLGVLAVKPTPRYFDIAFFFIAIGISILLAHQKKVTVLIFMGLFAITSLSVLEFDYLQPGLRGLVVDRSYHFLIFKDNSADPLPKQNLARFLGDKGCAYSQVSTADPRLNEALLFLSHGDWPISTQAVCPSAHPHIERVGTDRSAETGSGYARTETFQMFQISWLD